MQISTSCSSIARSLLFATTLGAPLVLGGCVVEPNAYYAQQQAYAYPDGSVVYASPVYAAPAYYPGYYDAPSVYIGAGGCCWRGGGGWRGGGWRR